jgi:GNAT superfamily N-acetyltransferase
LPTIIFIINIIALAMQVIRKAKLKDVETVLKLERELFSSQIEIVKKHSPEHLKDLNQKETTVEIVEKFIKRLIRSKNGLVLVAEIDGKPVGHAAVLIKKNIPIFKMEYIGELTDIYVREEYRGMGISTELKSEAFKWLKEKKIKKVLLHVFPDNESAIPVYNSWGFSPFLMEMRKSL